MSRIFLSHSSRNNAEARALADWLATQGFDDVFLDLDPQRGITALSNIVKLEEPVHLPIVLRASVGAGLQQPDHV